MDAETFFQHFRISKAASDQHRNGGSSQSVDMLLEGRPEDREKALLRKRMESSVQPLSRAAGEDAQLISSKESVLLYQPENPNVVICDHQAGCHLFHWFSFVASKI